MKTNRLIRKSTALFMALAVFAMIFTGCKKDDSSSSSSGSGGGGGGGGTGNYGTIVVGDQTYVVLTGVYEIFYDEDLQAYEVGIALLDSTSENANAYVLVIPFYEAIPSGTFTYYLGDEPQQGQCAGMFEKSGSNDMLYCTQGNVTVSKVGANYKIVSQGTAMAMDDSTMNFSVNFQGPLTEYSE
jgi:hypothetical protein